MFAGVNGSHFNECLGCKIDEESILCTDLEPVYHQIFTEHDLFHVGIKNNQTQQVWYQSKALIFITALVFKNARRGQ